MGLALELVNLLVLELEFDDKMGDLLSKFNVALADLALKTVDLAAAEVELNAKAGVGLGQFSWDSEDLAKIIGLLDYGLTNLLAQGIAKVEAVLTQDVTKVSGLASHALIDLVVDGVQMTTQSLSELLGDSLRLVAELLADLGRKVGEVILEDLLDQLGENTRLLSKSLAKHIGNGSGDDRLVITLVGIDDEWGSGIAGDVVRLLIGDDKVGGLLSCIWSIAGDSPIGVGQRCGADIRAIEVCARLATDGSWRARGSRADLTPVAVLILVTRSMFARYVLKRLNGAFLWCLDLASWGSVARLDLVAWDGVVEGRLGRAGVVVASGNILGEGGVTAVLVTYKVSF